MIEMVAHLPPVLRNKFSHIRPTANKSSHYLLEPRIPSENQKWVGTAGKVVIAPNSLNRFQ